MKNHIRLIVAAATLCLLPILFLSPLLLGQANNCNLTPFNGPCNYSAGCSLTIYQCSTWEKDGINCPKNYNTSLAVNLFSCTTGTATQACNPVTLGNGNAAVTTCVTKRNCDYNQLSGACTPDTINSTCYAPYYQSGTCPKG